MIQLYSEWRNKKQFRMSFDTPTGYVVVVFYGPISRDEALSLILAIAEHAGIDCKPVLYTNIESGKE